MESTRDNIVPFPRKLGMNLETVEEKCLAYLRQAPNPLVPVDMLLEFCRRDPECGKLERQELLDFLRPHELVKVVEGPEEGEEIGQDTFGEAGINMGPRVILNSRVPTKEQMADMIAAQMRNMTEMLVEALDLARKAKDEAHIQELETALQKSEALRQKMNKLL
jgi:hypothetical protein